MDKFRLQALEFWNRWQGLSLPQKLVWSLGVTGCLAVAGLMWWAAQPEYRVLYAGLSGEEAGAITTKLQAKGIPFKLASGGSTILVPTDQSMQAHLDMTTEGVAGSNKLGKGYDLFDQQMLSATPFNQHVNFLRAQQSELARTIMQIEPIAYARVHIVRPESSPFLRDQKPTTASVMVKLRPGATLNRNTVMGIASLVSGSVEGLPKENVRIVDANGRLLSVERDPDTGAVGTFLEMRRDVEQHLAKEAEHMLELVLGPGKAIVRVTADLDNKLVKKREEKINAEGRIAKTEKTILTKTTSGGVSKGGVVGSSSNLGKSPGTSGGASSAVSTTEHNQSDYEFPRTTIETQNRHGAIERLTIAAFIDLASLKNSDPPISLDEVKEAIKKAVGFKSDRDEIQVTGVKMPSVVTETSEEDTMSQARLQTILTIVRNVSIGAIALCVVPILWMLFRRRLSGPAAAPVASPQMQRLSEQLDQNPEALAKILSHWMEKPEAPTRKAA
jgi:flagellar M-ring protein FliF